jgi:hypothetical protein
MVSEGLASTPLCRLSPDVLRAQRAVRETQITNETERKTPLLRRLFKALIALLNFRQLQTRRCVGSTKLGSTKRH